tara:strand:- start:11667 stop:13121 length:1455 start_codon:yes stop_codon:yes gene_type:complete
MKKLIIITSPLYIRNYIVTEAFKKIQDDSTFFACTIDNISDRSSLVSYQNFVGEFESSNFKKSLFTFFSLLLMYSNRKLNKGFYFYFKTRNTTIYYPSLRLKNKASEWFSNKFLRFVAIQFLEFLRPFFHPARLFKFCLIITIDFFRLTNKLVSLYNLFLFENKELKSIIESVQPDLVIMPNGGLDPNAYEVLALSKICNFKTMLLIDNWDNLCSKSRFLIEPDYLGVWGNQAISHAEKFHKIDSSRVFLAGTPRFDVYQNYKNNEDELKEKYQEILNFPYILFAGTWPKFDEIGALEVLNDLVDKYKKLLPKNCKILYRPHPWGENYDQLDYLRSKNLKNIAIDPQMSKKSRPDDWTRRIDFQPDLDYYPILLDNSEFVICPLTSVIIEASLMNKKVLVLAYDDEKNFLNPAMIYDNSDYFDRLSELNSVKLLDNIMNLDKSFSQMITSDVIVNRKALSYYIVDDGQHYQDRIANICNKLTIN